MPIIFIAVSTLSLQAFSQTYIKNVEPSPNGNQLKNPAQIALFNENRLDMHAGGFAAQERSTDTQGQKVDAKGTKLFLNTTFKATPSFYWTANLLKYNRYTESVLGDFESNSSLGQWELQLSAAFKILDAVIIGAEYGFHDRKRGSDSLSESKSSANKTSFGLLYKANTWELGLGFKKITVASNNYLEYAVHMRSLINSTNAASGYVLKYPQESCCNLSTAKRYEVGIGYQIISDSSNLEITIAQRPAFEEGVEAEISQTIIGGLMEFGNQNASRFGFKSEYAFGEGKLRNRQVKYEKVTASLTYAQPI